ncbi:unnamed protein product [Onchocerca flexuosa]|uniref:Transposase n=1 Tax=Onchocerca flexuosa TaxID=387005 RepID=A0A183H1C7_9BILA|nr:unnamed protein product [Onchocerca flexuosa]
MYSRYGVNGKFFSKRTINIDCGSCYANLVWFIPDHYPDGFHDDESASKKPLTPQSKQYYEGSAQLIPHENNTKAVLLSHLDEFGSDERLESNADIPVYIIDSDAIVKPLDLLFLNG